MSAKKPRKRMRLILLTIIILFLALWIVWTNVTIGVSRYSVSSEKLPSEFDHYKIAVVSDLHNAEFGEGNSTIIEKIENEQPDIIAITGDLIDSNRTDVDVAADLINKLAKEAPCYYVTGNHEAWVGERYRELEERLTASGVVVLHDTVVSVENGGKQIQIAGLDDPDFKYGGADSQESMMRAKLQQMGLTDEYCILLSHRPETFNAYVSENIDLVLSGHTHGGQFRLPFIGGIAAPHQGLFPRYDAGAYSEHGTTMIVSRGVGNSVIPIRFNNRPEIVIVELTCE